MYSVCACMCTHIHTYIALYMHDGFTKTLTWGQKSRLWILAAYNQSPALLPASLTISDKSCNLSVLQFPRL